MRNLGMQKLEAAAQLARAYVYLDSNVDGIPFGSWEHWTRRDAACVIMSAFYQLLKVPMIEFMPDFPANKSEVEYAEYFLRRTR